MKIKENRLPIFLYSLFLLSAISIILFTEKGAFELGVNQHFTFIGGQFFRYLTHIGDGAMYAIIIALFLLIRYHYAIILFSISIVQTIFVQVMKKVIFPDAMRPSLYFENRNDITLQFAEGVKIHSVHSFPSGHTATAFAIAVFLTIIIKKPLWRIVFFILACLAGFSRIYLLQHFIEDVFTGAAIGIFSSVFCWWIFQRLFPQWNENKNLQKGLIRRV